MITRTYRFIDEEGFHVRPATQFTQLAKKFSSDVTIIYDNERFNGKSPLEIMSACIEYDMIFSLEIVGDDEVLLDKALFERMVTGKEAFFAAIESDKAAVVSPLNIQAPANDEQGVAVSPGVGYGPAYLFIEQDINSKIEQYEAKAADPEPELTTLAGAVSKLQDILTADLSGQQSDLNKELIKAHLAILDDPTFQDRIKGIIAEKKQATYAVLKAGQLFEQEFKAYKNEKMRQRYADIKDILNRLFALITNKNLPSFQPPAGSVIVAKDLLPSQTMQLKADQVAGFVLEGGGPNSHTAILARAMGLPALAGVKDALKIIKTGQQVALNGDEGFFVLDPPAEVAGDYKARQKANRQKWLEILETGREGTGLTADGTQIALLANVQSLDDIAAARDNGAEGVGLFRTEFIYMNGSSPPAENEQTEIYRRGLEEMNGYPVTYRTLDAGGDKPIASINLASETNPFLGVRGIRFSLFSPALFKTQIKALLLASATAEIKIMLPMISVLEEVLKVKEIINQVRMELKQSDQKAISYQLGIMIETPAAALSSEQLAGHVDFMSIGSNDLIQYTMAADRGNAALSDLANAFQPGVLRLIDMVASAAKKAGIPWTVCGESASDPLLAVFYTFLGAAGLSMSPPFISRQRVFLRSIDLNLLGLTAQDLYNCSTSAQVKERLTEAVNRATVK